MRPFLGVVSLNLGSKGSVNENFLLGGRNEIVGSEHSHVNNVGDDCVVLTETPNV